MCREINVYCYERNSSTSNWLLETYKNEGVCLYSSGERESDDDDDMTVHALDELSYLLCG